MAHYTLFILVLVAVASVNSTHRVRRDRLFFNGRNVSPGAQCQSRGNFGGVCKAKDPAERCLHLKCADTESFDIPLPNDVGPALEGTWCGDKKICIMGQCTDDPSPPPKPLVIEDFQYGCEEPL